MPSGMQDRLTGVLCATITPFHGEGRALDLDGIQLNTRWLLEHGLEVLIVNGTIGEATSMSADEQGQVIDATARAARGGAILISGCIGADAVGVEVLAKRAIEAGTDALLVQAPATIARSPQASIEFFYAIGAAIERPYLVYNNPASNQAELDPEALAQIARSPQFIGLKDATLDVMRFSEISERFADQFPVIAAAEDSLLFTLVAGASACMTATAAFAPGLLNSLVASVGRGDLVEARALFMRVQAFRRLFRARLRRGERAFIPYTKAAVELSGGRAGPPRPPLSEITPAERDELSRVMSDEMDLQVVPS